MPAVQVGCGRHGSLLADAGSLTPLGVSGPTLANIDAVDVVPEASGASEPASGLTRDYDDSDAVPPVTGSRYRRVQSSVARSPRAGYGTLVPCRGWSST